MKIRITTSANKTICYYRIYLLSIITPLLIINDEYNTLIESLVKPQKEANPREECQILSREKFEDRPMSPVYFPDGYKVRDFSSTFV